MFDDYVHKALSSEIRRQLILSLAERDKYLTELSHELNRAPQTIDFHLSILTEAGIVSSKTIEGKKYYSLQNKKILKYLRERKPIPAAVRPKPPHEIVIDAWQDITERLERIEDKLDRLLERKEGE